MHVTAFVQEQLHVDNKNREILDTGDKATLYYQTVW